MQMAVIIGVAILLIACAAWWLWQGGDGDIQAIKAAARSHHIATAATEMGDVLSPPDRLAPWDRRDVNAAINIMNEGIRLNTASCAGINACGDGSSGSGPNAGTKLPPTKQELDRALTSAT
jgi:hypothetical protein